MKNEFNNCSLKGTGVCLDGGSISFILCHPTHGESIIWLMQHNILEYYEEIDKIPGRIYLNENLIEKRSQIEKEILIFSNSEVAILSNQELANSLSQKLDWVDSEEYIAINPVKKFLSLPRIQAIKG